MSNLLNELSVTMKEISKAESHLAELEEKELALGFNILLNEKAKKALLADGVIVGDEVLKINEKSEAFFFEPMPVFADKFNFDEPEKESKNPFKVGDWVIMFNDETIASKVSYVEGDKVETENEMWSGHYESFSKIG